VKKLLIFVLFNSIILISSVIAQSNMPRLKEATFVESYSPTEVSIKAKGLGENVDEAEKDTKKSAVYFVIFSASDPVVQTDEEKASFSKIQEGFFENEHINSLITFMTDGFINKIKTRDGVKVEKLLRVNKGQIVEELTKQGVLLSKEEITQNLGNPFIMVIPEVAKGQNPLSVLQSNPNVKKGAEVIESYLTARKYDVQVPEQAASLNDLISAQSAIKGVEEDMSYKLALSVGADVYITYNVDIEKGFGGKKGVVGCRAYETTTAKLLGTETGYSKERPDVPDAALIEEAMNDAIDKVLSRINAYWKDDLKMGQQYKLIFNITGTFSDADAIAEGVDDVLTAMTTKKKENVSTDKVMDYIIWQKQYDSTNKMFRELKKKMEANSNFQSENATVKKINVNRKLMILSIENGA